MPIIWKKKFKPDLVINEIASFRTLNAERKVIYFSGEVLEHLPVLHSMMSFPEVAADIDQHLLIWKALNHPHTTFNATTFISSANEELTKLISTREEAFVILTSISLDATDLMRRINLPECIINLHPVDYPKKFLRHRENIINKTNFHSANNPKDYCKVSIAVNARSPAAAYSKAIRGLDLTRALLCILSNHVMQLSYSTQDSEPINKICLGGVHTVHKKNGEAAQEDYWYEPDFKKIKIFKPRDSAIFQKNFKSHARALLASTHYKPLTNSLLLYVRGFDLRDHNTAFLKCWNALEMLTTPNIANYDDMIKRSSFLFQLQNHDFHIQVLSHLRQFRNASVHAGDESSKAKIHCYQIQKYYFRVLTFLIYHSKKFKDIKSYCEFLGRPTNIEVIDDEFEKIKFLKKLLKEE